MNLIIVGASARAAAFSAHRAGMRPWCVDLFGDADLARRFPVRRVAPADYPHGLFDALADAPDGPLLYTGGLENYPDLLARIDRPLWGNPPEVLRRVRDPFVLADVLRRNGWPALEVRRDPPPRGDRRRWLLKPLRGSGGVGIRHYDGRSFDPRVSYLQEYRRTIDPSALFLGMPGHGARVLGIVYSLDNDWLGAPPFYYASSLSLENSEFIAMVPTFQALGDLLVREFGLAGLFGVDALLLDAPRVNKATVAPLEVNPRYTASVEIHERARQTSLLTLHAAVFEKHPIQWTAVATGDATAAGKAIVYAREDLTFPATGPWQAALDQSVDIAEYADIPHAAERIPRGRPLLTILASGPTRLSVSGKLLDRFVALDPHLHGR